MNKRALDGLVSEDRFLIAAAGDRAAQAMQRGQPCFTSFLDPGQQALLQRYQYLWNVAMFSYGGYQEAERQLLAFTPPGYEPLPEEYPLAAVRVSGNFNFASVSHRDYLGSLLALGIKRETVGDILVDDGGCQVVLQQSVVSFIQTEWRQVGRVGIKVSRLELVDLQPPQPKILWRQASVASLRLDAVVAVAYGIARSQAAHLIRGGKLKHNFVIEMRPDRTVSVGDTLSLAGHGRAQLRELGGQSKKGRQYIRVARFV